MAWAAVVEDLAGLEWDQQTLLRQRLMTMPSRPLSQRKHNWAGMAAAAMGSAEEEGTYWVECLAVAARVAAVPAAAALAVALEEPAMAAVAVGLPAA